QFFTNGKKAIFVPSGGQGRGEPMAEAKAMTNYLLSQGFHEEDILPEDRSVNTYENMKFSKAIIERENPHAKSIFVTTNYHLFRAGILARKVGFLADGLGSRTKWYFWPNAFVRELMGLLKGQLLRIFAVFLSFVLAVIFIWTHFY
ncbi:MAG: YdcF family protein, partial [Blautia sp.]|nr:YdcF family protein [Blautia sp.]